MTDVADDLGRPLIRTIEVRVFDGGALEIVEDGKTTGRLSWDECLGQIGEMTHVRIGKGRYQMMTPEEWAARRARTYNGECHEPC